MSPPSSQKSGKKKKKTKSAHGNRNSRNPHFPEEHELDPRAAGDVGCGSPLLEISPMWSTLSSRCDFGCAPLRTLIDRRRRHSLLLPTIHRSCSPRRRPVRRPPLRQRQVLRLHARPKRRKSLPAQRNRQMSRYSRNSPPSPRPPHFFRSTPPVT